MTAIRNAALLLSAFLLMGSAEPRADEPQTTWFEQDGEPGRGWLGVSIQDMNSRLARSMGVEATEGALVTQVMDDSPAEAAGCKEEDVILEFDGKPIADADDLRRAVRRTAPGSTVPLVLSRGSTKKTLQVKIGEMPEVPDVPLAPEPPLPPRVLRFETLKPMGLRLRTLNRQLGKYFQAPGGRGVLVEEVTQESQAEKAGFLAGDVITKAGRASVEDVRDIHRALRDAGKGETMEVEILRGGSSMKLGLKVEKSEKKRKYRLHLEEGDLEDFHLQLEHLGPDMDQLRLELNRLRDELGDRILDRTRQRARPEGRNS